MLTGSGWTRRSPSRNGDLRTCGRHGPKKDCRLRCQQQVRVSPYRASWPRARGARTTVATGNSRRTSRPWLARLPTTFASPSLQPDRACGVLTKQGALADVPTKHRRALVAGLLGDDSLGDPGSSSRGRKAGPQRVTCQRSRPVRQPARCCGAASRCPLFSSFVTHDKLALS